MTGNAATDSSPRAGRAWRLLSGGVTGNRRLIAMTGVMLHALLWVQIVSALIFALLAFNFALPAGPVYDVVRPVHFFVGFLLIPLVAIKLATTGYRFLLYYGRNRRYRQAGHPSLLARAVAGALVVSVVALIVSGVEMWSFANQFAIPWIPVHVISAMVFAGALTVHVILHLGEAHREAAADLAAVPPDPQPGELTGEGWRAGMIARRAFLGSGLMAGAGLAVSASQWPSVRLSWLAPRRAGAAPLDFPVMDYEGGAQIADLARWRLRVDGSVGRPLTLTYEQLAAMPVEEHEYSLNCVTGWTATRRWRGVPVAAILRQAAADPGFGHVRFRSTSGYHWSHTRDHCLLIGALLVTHVDGVALNDDHGFPARLMIPGTVGQSNVKWVDGLTVGMGAPELYLTPNLTFDNRLPVSGYMLPRDPAGRRP